MTNFMLLSPVGQKEPLSLFSVDSIIRVDSLDEEGSIVHLLDGSKVRVIDTFDSICTRLFITTDDKAKI